MKNLFCCIALLIVSGCGIPSFLITPVQNTNALEEVQISEAKGWKRDKIAVIEVEGMLINAKSGGFLQPTENPVSLFTQQLERAEKDESVKAVVLRVNSPGGTVTTSDIMHEQLTRFRARTHKPVVASFQEVAASGAYYVSCACDRIVTQPTSVVGSIGVIFNALEFEGTLAKIGARAESIKSGPLKDMGSPFKQLRPEERAVMQGIVDEYYARFLRIVKDARNVDSEKLKMATDGRIFSGERAVELGLADECGLLEDAIKIAARMAKVPGARAVMYKRPYGYRGSIYANSQVPAAQVNVLQLELPGAKTILPSGFYYLWNP